MVLHSEFAVEGWSPHHLARPVGCAFSSSRRSIWVVCECFAHTPAHSVLYWGQGYHGHYITLQYITSHCTTLRHTTHHHVTLYIITSHCATSRHTAPHYVVTLHHITSHCTTLCHTAPHHVTLHHITLLHCTTLYITLHILPSSHRSLQLPFSLN